MIAKLSASTALFAALGAWTLFAAGCVHPLGPGYNFENRQTEIRASDSAAGGIHFRVVDQLLNNGDRALRSLEVRLPLGPAFGEPDVRVSIEGTEIAPQHASKADFRRMRAQFDPVWDEDQQRKIISEWDLAPEILARGTIATGPNGFFIADETALPIWQTPRGVFPHGGASPHKGVLTISVPADFRVLAPGKQLKAARSGNQLSERFLIDPKRDFLPYVVAGRYQEKMIHAEQGDVQFWTFHPMDGQEMKTVAEQLSSSMTALADFFGAASEEKIAVKIVESPVHLPPEFGQTGEPGGISFPQGVLFDSETMQQGLAREAVLRLAEYELTRSWFGWVVRPSAEAQILMGRGAGLFGLVIVAEGHGTEERRRMIASLIERYDAARALAPDKRLMEPPVGYSRAERISTGYRAALFFVALEDVCGHENLEAAMRDIIHARGGSETGYQELRAAVESASGKDLAEMFRVWLVQPGIPQDFRARYQTAAAETKDAR